MAVTGKARLSPVWGLTAVVAAATALLSAHVLMDLGPLRGAPVSLPWYVLAPLFYVSELTVIHLKFNRHAHSFSMTEIPILIGLHLAAPIHLIIGQMTGALAAFAHRRQAPVKVAFNTAQFGLQTATALLVFRGIADVAPPLGLATSGAGLLAVMAALLVANVLVNMAIRLSGGRLTVDEMIDVLTLGSFAALMNGALGLVAVNIVWLHPSSAWLAAVPPAVLFLAYRAYVTQRQERTRLAAIHEVTRELHRTPQIEAALEAVTSRARALFEAELAEVTILPVGSDQAFVTGAGPGTDTRVMERVDIDVVDPLVIRAMRAGKEVAEGVPGGSRHQGSAMAAPLYEDEAAIGAFVVRHPLGDVSAFGPSDRTMLATLASQVSVSLANGRLQDSLAQLTRLKEKLHHQALHDGLTGLANRRLLQDALESVLADPDREGSAALLYLDLDDFKAVNDSLGHQAGDEVLRLAADRLRSACRPGDTVARIGGDEFAVLLVGLPHPEEAEAISDRILTTIRRPFVIGGNPVFVSASLGIALVTPPDGDRGAGPAEKWDDILRRADQAMYAAKWREKGSYEVFAESMSEAVRRRIELRSDIRDGLEDGSINLAYQPVVELVSGEIVGAEALIRWTHPLLGPIEPTELLSVAEEMGLMVELAEWTVERAVSDLAPLHRLRPELWFSINLSADQLEMKVVDAVARQLAAYDFDPRALAVEITETAATQSAEAVLEKLSLLGVQIALDDFGTGYSSLARLDTLPIDLLKIDRSFVERTTTHDGSPLIRVMLEIGATLGLDTIAEGVETPGHRDALVEMGCRYAQGYLFSAALPIDQLREAVAPAPVPVSIE